MKENKKNGNKLKNKLENSAVSLHVLQGNRNKRIGQQNDHSRGFRRLQLGHGLALLLLVHGGRVLPP